MTWEAAIVVYVLWKLVKDGSRIVLWLFGYRWKQ